MPRTYTERLHPRGHGGKWTKKGVGDLADGPDKPAATPEIPRGAKAPTKAAKPAKSKPHTAESSKKFIDDHYGEWRKSLTPAQDKGMRFYQSPGFALMNGQLRGLDTGELKKSERATDADLARARTSAKNLTAAIKTAPPLKEDTTVYRGFSADQFGKLTEGATVTDKGFTSTSLTDDAGAVGKAARKATAEITLPAGTKAAAGSARELVLPPGAKFRVTSVTTKNGAPHVKMEYVLPRGQASVVTASGSLTAQRDLLLAELDDPPEHMTALLDELDDADLDPILAFAETLGSPSDADLAEMGLTAAGRKNWVQQTGTGHLPRYIKRIEKHLRKKGMTESHAIAVAVNVAKKMCASGDINFPGVQQVNAKSRAEACAAVAEWESKKAQAHAT